MCTYTVLECGSHAGCRAHDACYDACTPGFRGIACRRSCDLTAVTNYGASNCNSWASGGGPYDSWLSFVAAPTSYTYDSTCY